MQDPGGPPKFSSFRAKPAPPAVSASEALRTSRPHGEKDIRDREQEERHRSRSKLSHSYRHHERSKCQERDRSAKHDRNLKHEDSHKQERKHSPAPLQSSEGYNDELEDLFVIDRRGDVGNLKYGYNEKYKVPDYRAPSVRKLLGNRAGEAFEDSRGLRGSPLTTLNKEDKQSLKQEAHFITRKTVEDAKAEKDLDYIVLNPGRKRKRVSPRTPHRLLKIATDDDATNSSGSEAETLSASTSDVDDTTSPTTSSLKIEQIRLSKLVKEEPASASAWLAYIGFQDEWARQGQQAEEFTIRREDQRSIADVKLSIFQKALASVPTAHPDREKLLLGMMEEADVVLDGQKLAAKWEQVVAHNPSYQRVRQRYLDYSQSEFVQFDYGVCRQRYSDYMQGLAKDAVKDSSTLVYTLLRLTSFIFEAGFQELAVALWQALLELNCFSLHLTQKKITWEDTLSLFEAFWDDEKPRIGEEGASGWQTLDTSAEALGNSLVANSDTKSPRGSLSAWLQTEKLKQLRNEIPGRITDEDVDDDDPYHVVLFSDIQPFLYHLHFDGFPEKLVNAFLCFNHLPALPSTSLSDNWCDPFLRNDTVDDSLLPPAMQDQGSVKSRFGSKLSHCQTTLQTLFDRNGELARRLSELGSHTRRIDFISNVLKALVAKHSTWNDLIEYCLAFEVHMHPTTVRKLARTLLKTSSSNLRLYNAYALIEMRLGKSEAADHVISTAISMSSTFSDQARSHLIYLWQTWIWEALTAGKHRLALELCHRVSETGTIQQVAFNDINHAEQYFNIGRNAAVEQSSYQVAASHSICLAILYYLSSSRNITTALEAFTTQASIVASYGPSTQQALEALHQARAALIDYHITNALPYSPAIVRAATQISISTFPSNTIFLDLYAKIEARSRMDDRVRQVARDILTGPEALSAPSDDASHASNLIAHIFAIETEFRRTVVAGSTRHAVRTAFERAVSDRLCRHSATIWTMYLQYELDLVVIGKASRGAKDEGMGKAKDVFYRGLKCLPWCKVWYMKGVEVLTSMGEEANARELVRLMGDRGLRVLVELD